ncbi:hypothetical protein CHL67_07380 [Prosthecochloris sp. GSB1]|uniref:hypothetical protein n=1 Tax=Prosthecochloris sp. GSB1 TaxID=281093 RepID=UPI000B8CC2AF|nr:hypothetical protein [Prosthecochloris sp. GSB1]ASQ90764.1 hypothetical protein CHL67_07380 [Prosthecochloris sp. GSB1]
MTIPYRPLGIVREMITGLGHEVAYAYDDLVFVDHNACVLQFTDSPENLKLYFNIELPDEDAEKIAGELVEAAGKRNMRIELKGHYELAQMPGENLEIKFFDRRET